jgi:RNA polymerase sigma-70 factor, ECF subfamily
VNQVQHQHDTECIAAVRGGDQAAFGQLVTKYQDRLFNTLTRLLGSADAAEDLTQDALVQAYLKLDTFQGNSAFYTWLYRIAFNLAMSHARRRRPVSLPDRDDSSAPLEPTDNQPLPHEQMVTQEQIDSVSAAIDSLASEHREVVVLREIEGFDYEQIASILEIPIGTVRSRLFRARMQLKAKLVTRVATDESV